MENSEQENDLAKHVKREEWKKAHKDFFFENPWQWHANLQFKNPFTEEASAQFTLRKWLREIGIKTNLQIACQGVLNFWPISHLHVLVFGYQKRTHRTLLDVNPKECEKIWPGDAVIKTIYDKKGVINYLVERNMPHGRHTLIIPYGNKHLKRFAVASL
jgi:hypothetical protein